MSLQSVGHERPRPSEHHSIPIDAHARAIVENPILNEARRRAAQAKLGYAGSIAPVDAWQLFTSLAAIIIDVRSPEERLFVGYVPGTLHAPWANGVGMVPNPNFLRELEARVAKDSVVLFLCRSGKRSAAAAAQATKAGWQHAFSIAEGFEGELDNSRRRGQLGGWRHRGLPWIQQ
ncbi:MAG TPA: rhodanese-like domain-containing protein [Pseudomonadales bacterium]|nr:rhodanese-like domain-containing protein [Pseudomonadales bacterium]